MGNSHNLYTAAHADCKLGEVMVLIDGDDSLIGRQVFALLNAYYQREKPPMVYTQLLHFFPGHVGNGRNRPIQ